MAEYAWGSLRLLFSVLALALPMAAGGAYLTTHFEFPLRRMLDHALTLSLALPAYLLAIVYGQLFSSSGPLQFFIRETWNLQYGEYWFVTMRSASGAACILALALYPYAYMLCRTALHSPRVELSDVARMLGASPLRMFWRVTLPMLRPALIAGGALIAMETLADFGVVSLYATPTFTTGIYRTMFGVGDTTMAIRMAGVLLFIVMIALLIERKARPERLYETLPTSSRPALRRMLTGWRAGLAVVACALPALFGFLIPVSVLTLWSLRYRSFWHEALTWEATLHSVTIAASVCVVVATVALLMAAQLRYRPTLMLRAAVRLASSGYVMPGIVIAVSIMLPLIAFDRQLSAWLSAWTGESYGLILTGTIFSMVLACSLRFFSVGMQTIEAGWEVQPMTLDHTARSLGVSGAHLFWRVHLPILRPSIIACALIVFVETLKELPASYILRPFNFDTLAIRAFELASDEKYYEAAPSSLLLISAGVSAMLLLNKIMQPKAAD